MHLIHTHSIDIQCPTGDFGKKIHQQLGYLLKKEFYPKLEMLFDKYEYKNHIWSIDFLELNLPEVSRKNWKTELIKNALFQAEEYLKNNRPVIKKIPDDNKITSGMFFSDKQYALLLFFDFLKTGNLIANSISEKLVQVLMEIEINYEFLQKVIETFRINPSLLIRWIFSVPENFKENVLSQINDFTVNFNRIIDTIFKNSTVTPIETDRLYSRFLNKNIKSSQWIEFFQWVLYLYPLSTSKKELIQFFKHRSENHWSISPNDLKNLADVILKNRQIEKSDVTPQFINFIQELNKNLINEKNEFENNFQDNNSKDIYFISNSGLVIFHPFLEKLFEQLDLYKNEKWIETDSQYKAILLTQYLITGQEEFYENELVLNKILCGLSADSEINTKLEITEKEKDKCQSLIEAVLEHWKTMSGSSVEALRETFLLRAGKLDLNSSYSYELWVEERGVDILLAQLPWGIGMIKTPWMEHYLTCNWN